MTKLQVLVVAGDGIGVEVTREAVRVLEHVAKQAISSSRSRTSCSVARPSMLTVCLRPMRCSTRPTKADAVLLGAVGGPRWDSVPGDKRP